MTRYTTHSQPGRLIFVIPRVFSIFFFVLIPVFVACLLHIAAHARHPEDLFGRAGVILMIALSVWLWLWKLSGKEVLEFTPTELIYRRILFGISWTNTYRMEDLQGPHFKASRPGKHGRPSSISFTYDGKTKSICYGIKQPEAKALVGTALEEFPLLNSTWGVEKAFDAK